MNSTGVPYFYDYANVVDSYYSPSEIHLTDTKVVQFYQRYLLQKAMSPFKWTLPENWAKNYFLYTLYEFGYLAVINTDKFGVIPQACGLMGYNVFYQPARAIITNPLLTGIREPRIGEECTIIRLQPNYSGVMDIVSYHARLLGLAYETLTTNLLNSKLAYVATAENKADAEMFKKLYDQIASGVPSVVHRKRQGAIDESTPPFNLFQQNIGQNFITPELLESMREIEMHFDNELGIPVNMQEQKKERTLSAEVNVNQFETRSKCALWLEELQKACKETRDMFGIDISVDWRDDYGRDAINPGATELGQERMGRI